ncbi:SRPBCC family protein [Actinoplanes sp. DH11]|uniref:SRPBCC family protein n=1 Tax=Actinoplanes sp. DH11 TaxID=2857011 RepID=UPI001E4041CB|nr:SRPBCC family protein [Actinoplanes sp. DH11]
MSMVQQAIEISAPVHTVYEQLAAFENYPRFMTGVRQVTATGADQTHWIMDVDGKRREFDAQIIERSLDERVSWSTMEGPLLAETLTLRPMGETKTQIVAQLEADIAFLMPSDRHGQESLNRRLKADLATFKGLVESGVLGGRPIPTGASSKQMTGRSFLGEPAGRNPASPASVAQRIRNRHAAQPAPGAGIGDRSTPASGIGDRSAAASGIGDRSTQTPGLADRSRPTPSIGTQPAPSPGAGWDTGAADLSNADPTGTGLTDNPLHNTPTSADIPAPGGIRAPRSESDSGRRGGGTGPRGGGVAGSARMGGRTANSDMWGDGMINEEERGS